MGGFPRLVRTTLSIPVEWDSPRLRPSLRGRNRSSRPAPQLAALPLHGAPKQTKPDAFSGVRFGLF
ncbi:hypothetical protein HMPREF9413_1840 [Paenibacillus sp. HGF7]|nr:hypothetical protein HMPREF9413_1840 [Paenibacillus sp. HGF7]